MCKASTIFTAAHRAIFDSRQNKHSSGAYLWLACWLTVFIAIYYCVHQTKLLERVSAFDKTSSPKNDVDILTTSLGEEEAGLYVSHTFVCLFCACMFLSFFSSSWCRGLAAVCDCSIPWTFLLTFLNASSLAYVPLFSSVRCGFGSLSFSLHATLFKNFVK